MGKPLVGIGIALIVAGALLLGYLGRTVFRVIDAPQDVSLVKFITNHARVEDKANYGHAGRDSFEINVRRTHPHSRAAVSPGLRSDGARQRGGIADFGRDQPPLGGGTREKTA